MAGRNLRLCPRLTLMGLLVAAALLPAGGYARTGQGSPAAWMSLRGVLSSAPTVVADGNRIDVLVRGSRGDLWDRWFDGQTWQPWESLGGSLAPASAPAAVAEGSRIDVFTRGPENHLWHRWFDGQSWQPWEDLGGVLSSAPAVVAEGNRIDVFVRGTEGDLWHRWFDGQQWQPWESLGFLHGRMTSGPFAVAQGTRIDVFARGVAGNVDHLSFDGQQWAPWESLGGRLPRGVIPQASWEGDLLTVFARGTDHGLYFNYQSLGQWTRWQTLQGSLVAGPAVISSATRTDLFVQSTSNTLAHLADDHQMWPSDDAWTSLGGRITSRPGVVQTGSSLVVFARGRDRALWELPFPGGAVPAPPGSRLAPAAAARASAPLPAINGTHAYYPGIMSIQFCVRLTPNVAGKLMIQGFAFLGDWAPSRGTPQSELHAPPGDWTWTYTIGKTYGQKWNGWSVYSPTQVLQVGKQYCFSMPVYNSTPVTFSTRLAGAAQEIPEQIVYPALSGQRAHIANVVSRPGMHPLPLGGVPPGAESLIPGPAAQHLTYTIPLPPRLCTIIDGVTSAPRPCSAAVTVTLDAEVVGPALRTLSGAPKGSKLGPCSPPAGYTCDTATYQICSKSYQGDGCNIWSNTLAARYSFSRSGSEVRSGPIDCPQHNVQKKGCVWPSHKANASPPPPGSITAVARFAFPAPFSAGQSVPITQKLIAHPSGHADPACPQIGQGYTCPLHWSVS